MQGFKYRLILVPFLLAVTVGTTACGKVSPQNSTDSSSLDYSTKLNGTSTDIFNSGTATPTPTPTTDIVGTTTPLKFIVRGVGYDTPITFNISTINKLKVKFVPGVQDRPVTGTNVLPAYSQLAVNLGVGDDNSFTPLLGNGASTTHPQTASSIVDFSADIPACDDGTTTCTQSVTVTVQHPNYDYWAYVYNQYYFFDKTNGWYYTDHTDVYSTHPWNGILYVETNFTRVMNTGLSP